MKKEIIAVLIGLFAAVIITEVFRSVIFFSLFIGIPSGLAAGVISYMMIKNLE